MNITNQLLSYNLIDNGIEIVTDGGRFQVIFLTQEIIRIRCTFDEAFKPEASYILTMTAWDDAMDNLLQDERRHVEAVIPRIEESNDSLKLNTDKLIVYIDKNPFGFRIYNLEGELLHADLKEKAYMEDDYHNRYHYSVRGEHDAFYGFGEKTGNLDKVISRMIMNNVDTVGYDAKNSDPLYKHIPFYIKFNKKNQIASGMFYHNSWKSTFDMGCEHSGYWGRQSYFCTQGGDIDWFFIYGPSIKDVVNRYTDLTGKTILPPKYSLGYMASTMYYTELPSRCDEAIYKFSEKVKSEGIPCDGFHMSSGYTSGDDGKRYVFHWNDKRFPNPQEFFSKMHSVGIEVSPNVKPGVLLTHPLYNDFKEQNAFIKVEDESEPYVDRFWGGPASFIDFTNPKARSIWKKQLTDQIIRHGVSAIWNDNNEFEMKNMKAMCDYEGRKEAVGGIRPILSNLMARTAYEAVTEYFPNKRPYILNRAGFSGIQRYAQTWAGDNSTSWDSLKYNITTMLNMGLSGVANQGIDVGGFAGPAPEPELFVRWVQSSAFYPRCCIHSMNSDNTVTEPWMYQEYTKFVQEALIFRYQLVPYLYSLLYEASMTGAPIMRPLVYEFSEDIKVYEEGQNFMVGPNMLIASIVEKGQKIKEVYLPAGANWFDWYTMAEYSGGQTISVPISINNIPVFIRSGSIIPMQMESYQLHLNQYRSLEIFVEPSMPSEFSLYEDDGISNDYKEGKHSVTQIAVNKSIDSIGLSFHTQGSYVSEIEAIYLKVLCKESAPRYVFVADRTISRVLSKEEFDQAQEVYYYDIATRIGHIKYLKPQDLKYQVTLEMKRKNIVSV